MPFFWHSSCSSATFLHNFMSCCFVSCCPASPLGTGCIAALTTSITRKSSGYEDGVLQFILCQTFVRLDFHHLQNPHTFDPCMLQDGYCHHLSANICWSWSPSAVNSRLYLWHLLIQPSSRMVISSSYIFQPLLVWIAISREFQTVPLTAVDSTKPRMVILPSLFCQPLLVL